ncbi:hypothetical protein IFM89_027428 [Coptis chinensis]|uniref:RRM domain-containing protein n=1 Tax=Coptis chinensis TaxID=261450 RepID=A0A835H5W4_9MAGN|nr:hypothetical protein IFM89_027428 [Coptis chinensis]
MGMDGSKMFEDFVCDEEYGNCVVCDVCVDEGKKFAIVEMRSEEAASGALELNGSLFQGNYIDTLETSNNYSPRTTNPGIHPFNCSLQPAPVVSVKTIETFFNDSTISSCNSGIVCDVYVDKEKKFAIVEMRSEQAASRALELNGSLFQFIFFVLQNPNGYIPASQKPAFTTCFTSTPFTTTTPLIAASQSINVGRRGPNFSLEEDEALCKAWVAIGEDSVVGICQTEKRFWERALDAFHEILNYQTGQSSKGISDRWGVIQLAINKFCGFLGQLEAVHQSGMTMQNRDCIMSVFMRDLKQPVVVSAVPCLTLDNHNGALVGFASPNY